MCGRLETTWACGHITPTFTKCGNFTKYKYTELDECPRYKLYTQTSAGDCVKYGKCAVSKNKK